MSCNDMQPPRGLSSLPEHDDVQRDATKDDDAGGRTTSPRQQPTVSKAMARTSFMVDGRWSSRSLQIRGDRAIADRREGGGGVPREVDLPTPFCELLLYTKGKPWRKPECRDIGER